MLSKNIWDLLFFVFFYRYALEDFFALFAENNFSDFRKNETNGKTGCSSMCMHISPVSFHFTFYAFKSTVSNRRLRV